MRILLINNNGLANLLSERLVRQRYVVDVAPDSSSAYAYIELSHYDLVLLSLAIVDGGIAFCREIRQTGYSNPLMVLMTEADTAQKISVLDAGADDCIVKPFDFDEMCARIRALLRREQEGLSTVLEWGAIQFDSGTSELTYANCPVRLTPKELSLIEHFLRHPYRIHSLNSIMDDIWSLESPPGKDAIRTHVKGLRRKLQQAGAPKGIIQTVYGLGYRLGEAKPTNDQKQLCHHLLDAQKLIGEIEKSAVVSAQFQAPPDSPLVEDSVHSSAQTTHLLHALQECISAAAHQACDI